MKQNSINTITDNTFEVTSLKNHACIWMLRPTRLGLSYSQNKLIIIIWYVTSVKFLRNPFEVDLVIGLVSGSIPFGVNFDG